MRPPTTAKNSQDGRAGKGVMLLFPVFKFFMSFFGDDLIRYCWPRKLYKEKTLFVCTVTPKPANIIW